jgi:hypothetical protein
MSHDVLKAMVAFCERAVGEPRPIPDDLTSPEAALRISRATARIPELDACDLPVKERTVGPQIHGPGR